MNESNDSPNINNRFLDFFDYNEKDKYNWELISSIKDEKNKRNVFRGLYKEEKEIIYVKQIKIIKESYDNNKIIQILREIYFLVFLKNQKYFTKLNNFLLSTVEDKKMIFLIFKENTSSLRNVLNSKYSNLLDIKKIFYQITYGLYVLHYNNIIHSDIKTSNIVINEEGDSSIIDFGSAIYKREQIKEYTLPYAAPEFLFDIKKEMDEKMDMWPLGIVLLELYLKTNYFQNYNQNNNEGTKCEKQLRFILSKFGFNENITKEEINDLINGNSSNEILLKPENEIYNKIQDNDALDLINNLLILNPKKRFSAKKVLQSNYLNEFYGDDPIDLDKLISPIDENELKGPIDENKFQNIFDLLKKKLNE